ncbi:MAG: stage V sporulation protein AD [Clostridia bacterium]|nr:stage V sporulation protein AD [Clostridia bacterium]
MNVKTLHKGNNCDFLFKDKMPEFLSKHEYTRQTIFFNNPPSIVGKMAVGGCKEGDGPVGKYLDKVHCEDKIGEKTFEKAEIDMLTEAATGAIKSSGIKKEDVDLFIAGDLLNQITSSSYVARDLGIPYAGIYSACSTMSEGLALASMMLNAGYFDNILCATVSHFATAERQYRYPLEYGCQRPPYAQWTVTGAGATMLSRGGNGPKITGATFGKVVDWGTNDLNNMGASMAPAAMSSLIAMFNDTGTEPDDFDLILTGDLGKLGSDIL